MLTWKIVGTSNASVLYIYIDNNVSKGKVKALTFVNDRLFFFFCLEKKVRVLFDFKKWCIHFSFFLFCSVFTLHSNLECKKNNNNNTFSYLRVFDKLF